MKGSCLCGKIRYRVSTFEPVYANCFCTMCQKSSGSAFATYAPVRAENLQWLEGQGDIKIYRSSGKAERGFCPHCGSNLYYRELGDDTDIEIALGTLDEEPDYPPTSNIHTATKPGWSDGIETLPGVSGARVRD